MTVETATDQTVRKLQSQIAQLESDIELITGELVARQDELVTLYNLAQAYRSILSEDDLINITLKQLSELLRAESSFLVLTRTAEHVSTHQFPAKTLDDALIMRWYASLRVHGRDVMVSTEDEQFPMLGGVDAIIAAPIVMDGKIRGMVGVANKRMGPFSAPDRKKAFAVGEQISSQLECIILHEQLIAQARIQSELDLARRVQHSLLPQSVPIVDGLDLAAGSTAAREVGGDFYDFITKPNEFVFAVGDVSGKGMSAALLMAMARTTVRNLTTRDEDVAPVDLLETVNNSLYDDFSDVSMFATMFVGSYCPKDQTVRYANAGHSPVIYCPANGKSTMLEATGVPVGVFEATLTEAESLTLAPGDVLMVITDGYPEAENSKGEMIGYDFLYEIAEWAANSNTNASAAEIYTRMERAVLAFTGNTSQTDDMTLMVLKGKSV